MPDTTPSQILKAGDEAVKRATTRRVDDLRLPPSQTDMLAILAAYKLLRDTVAKLPTTADGVPVTPGMRYWFEYEDSRGRIGDGLASHVENENGDDDFSACYSTESAAQQALQQKEQSNA